MFQMRVRCTGVMCLPRKKNNYEALVFQKNVANTKNDVDLR